MKFVLVGSIFSLRLVTTYSILKKKKVAGSWFFHWKTLTVQLIKQLSVKIKKKKRTNADAETCRNHSVPAILLNIQLTLCASRI